MIATRLARCVPVVAHGFFLYALGAGLALHGQTPEASTRAKEGRPLGAPAAFAPADRDTVEIPGGGLLRRAPTLAATVAFEFPQGATEQAEVLDRRETASGEWLRVRYAGVYGWYRASEKELDQVAALFENAARLERRQRLGDLARALFEKPPTELSWSLTHGEGIVEVPVRLFADLRRAEVRVLRDLISCAPALYAARFGPALPSRGLPVDVFVFGQREEYDGFVDSELATSIQESGGLELDGLVFVNGETTELNRVGTVAHELTHVLNRFAFPPETLPVWIEEGMAEDIAHSVEAGVLAGRSPCSSPGGWARTRVRESTEFVDGRPTRRTDLQRTGRGRVTLCYEGPDPDDPDVRDLTPLEFGASYRREVLYLEAVLLWRDLIGARTDPSEVRSLALGWRRAVDPRPLQEVVERVFATLSWRATERSWMQCP